MSCSPSSSCCYAAIGIALIVIGSLGVAGVMGNHSFGWTTFGVSLPTGFIALPIIAALSAYGIVSMTAVGGVAITTGAIAMMISCCCSSPARNN